MQDLERDDSPQFRNNVFTFFLCFVLSVLAGTLVANLFSGARMRGLVLAKLQAADPKVDWDLGDLSLVLSRQGIPRLSIWTSHLKIKKGDSCEKRLEVSALDFELSVSLMSLIRGPVRLSHARFGNVEIGKWPGLNDCGAEGTAGLPFFDVQAVQDGQSSQSVIADREAIQIPVSSLEVGRLTLRSPRLPVEIQLLDIEASHSPSRIRIRSEVGLKSESGDDLAPFRVEAESTDLFETAQVTLRWREATLRSHVEGLRQPPVRLQAAASKLPTLEIYRLLRLLKIVKNEVPLGSNWVDFTATLAHEPKRILFEKIQLGGDLGSVKGEELELHLEPKLELLPFEARLERLRLSEIVKTLQVEPVKRTMSSPGEFVGSLKYGEDRLQVRGQIEKAQILVTSEGRKINQDVESVRADIEYERPARLSIQLSEAKLRHGQWKGGLKVQADLREREGQFDLDFDELELDPRVFDVLYGMRLGKTSGSVSVKLSKGFISDLRGEARIADASGKNWEIKSAKLDAAYHEGAGQGQFSAEKFQAKSADWEHARVWERAFGSSEMNQVRGGLSFANNKYHVGPLGFRVGLRGTTGKMDLNFEDVAQGALSLQYPGVKGFQWSIDGGLQDLRVTPRDSWTSELHARSLEGEGFRIETLRPGNL